MMIHFKEELVSKALQLIDAHGLADAANDLGLIQSAIDGVKLYGNTQSATILNEMLRRKYPTIKIMLDVANTMPRFKLGAATANHSDFTIIDALQQDRCGILCDVLLKKGIIQSAEQFIDGTN